MKVKSSWSWTSFVSVKFRLEVYSFKHTFSTDGTSNDYQIRNMQVPVCIITEPAKDEFKFKLKYIKIKI